MIRSVTSRETEWDDAERDQMLALVEYEAGVCDCGFHESVIDPKTLHVTFEDRDCPICAGAAQYRRYLDDRDDQFLKGLGKDAPARTPRPSDGRRTFIKPVPPREKPTKKSGGEQ